MYCQDCGKDDLGLASIGYCELCSSLIASCSDKICGNCSKEKGICERCMKPLDSGMIICCVCGYYGFTEKLFTCHRCSCYVCDNCYKKSNNFLSFNRVYCQECLFYRTSFSKGFFYGTMTASVILGSTALVAKLYR